MDFLKISEAFEQQIIAKFKFELLELHYSPYSFGSGTVAYRINGKLVKIIFDGRDAIIEIILSAKHDKYPNGTWTNIFTGTVEEFLTVGIEAMKTDLSN